ncbi:MAG: hypothetical protein JNL28_15210 [Planctomycetes bacterium]|nr:hypothetical protein [Planctomycetota bacterium]
MNHTASFVAGLALLTSSAAIAMQGASEPVNSAPECFVTGKGSSAHLWVREGVTLRALAHGACKTCAAAAGQDHKAGDGHDHKPGDGHDHK